MGVLHSGLSVTSQSGASATEGETQGKCITFFVIIKHEAVECTINKERYAKFVHGHVTFVSVLLRPNTNKNLLHPLKRETTGSGSTISGVLQHKMRQGRVKGRSANGRRTCSPH